jgi:hypothetical protein
MDLLKIIQNRIKEKPMNEVLFDHHVSRQAPTLARQQTLYQAMTAMRETAFDRVVTIWPEGVVATQEILEAEIEITRIHDLVMTGKVNLEKFQEALEWWELIIYQEIKNSDFEKE